jgi:hypothetical protein
MLEELVMREANSLAGMAAISAEAQEVRRQWLTILDKLGRMKRNTVHG